MKAESTALAGQKEITRHEKKERADTDHGFSFWLSVVVRVYLFADFAFTGSCLVCAHPKLGAANFCLSLHLPG